MSRFVGNVGDPLNSMWRINVSGQVYGPYTGHQIKAFAAEGRVAAHSIVQTGEAGPWITAIDDPVLAQFFVVSQPPAATPMAQPIQHKKFAAPAEPHQQARATEINSAHNSATTDPNANFIIIGDIRGRSSAPFEAALNRLGTNYRLNQLVWLLHSDKSAGAIRNELVQHLGQTDSVFIADASRGKMAWFNLGPEADARIRKVWQKQGEKTS